MYKNYINVNAALSEYSEFIKYQNGKYLKIHLYLLLILNLVLIKRQYFLL